MQQLHIQIPRPNSVDNPYEQETPQLGSLRVPVTITPKDNNYDKINVFAISNNNKINTETSMHSNATAERSTTIIPGLFDNNTTSNSENTSVSSLWNYKMASFISVAENTWDKPISASQTGTYTLSSDSTDEWIYEKAAEVIVDDPQQQLQQQEKHQNPMDNNASNDHNQEQKLQEETTTAKMAPVAPPTYTNVAKITSYDAYDKTSDIENGSCYSAIEMEIKPERIAELEKKVAEKMKLGSNSVLSKSSDLVKRSCIAPSGKLGVFIDTTKSGPIIHNVKETSPVYNVLFTGDQIIAIDDVDVRSMTAAAVTKIMTKRAQHNRKITVLSANSASF